MTECFQLKYGDAIHEISIVNTSPRLCKNKESFWWKNLKQREVQEEVWTGQQRNPVHSAVDRAIEGVMFIADHLKEEDKEQQVIVIY